MEQGKGNDHEERCLVPMEFSAVVVRRGSWEGQKNGRRQRFAFHVEPSLMPLRYLSGTEGTRVRGSIEQEMKNGNKTGNE